MANPLARVVMNNITQRSGKVDTKPNFLGKSFNTVHLDSREEQLLKSITGKKNGNVSSNQILTTLDSLTNARSSTNVSARANNTAKVRSNPVNKINLEDLVKGNNRIDKKEKKLTQKSNAMVTLNELAGKVKKNIEVDKTGPQEIEFQNNSKSNYVRTGLVNNLEAYIPKVSLDSIGKKGSLLK